MLSPIVPATIAALIIIPTLFVGAYYDYRSRKFPKVLWNVPGKIAFGFTILAYLLQLANNDYNTVLTFICISTVLSLIFYTISIRTGSGGDYRALMYIVWIAPSIAIMVTCLALAIGVLQVALELFTKRSAPWAIGIFIAYVTSLLYTMRPMFF